MDGSSFEMQHFTYEVCVLGSVYSSSQSHPVAPLICSQIEGWSQSHFKLLRAHAWHVSSEALLICSCVREEVDVDPLLAVPLRSDHKTVS